MGVIKESTFGSNVIHFIFVNYPSRNRDVRSGSGVISSPRWPLPYQSNDFNSWFRDECEWDIEIQNKGKLIQLNFMDVHFEGSGYCDYSPHVSYKGL